MKQFINLRFLIVISIIAFMLLIPILVKDSYTLHLLIMTCIFCILTQSLNVILGYTGYFSFAHAGLYGIGAYTSALLSVHLGLTFWICLPAAGIVSVLFSLAIGYPSLRTKGIYFGLVTIAFGVILSTILDNWMDVTSGPMGIRDIPHPTIYISQSLSLSLKSKPEFYYLVIVITFVNMFLMYRIIHSKIGSAFKAIRENEALASAVGIDIQRYKVLSFSISAFFAGLGGSLYAHYVSFISPVSFTISVSFGIFAMLIIGGAGTFIGPIIGSILLIFLPEYLRGFAQYQWLIYGICIVTVIILMPKGIIGSLEPYIIQILDRE